MSPDQDPTDYHMLLTAFALALILVGMVALYGYALHIRGAP